ncbi:MAG: hypothetical protein JWM12_1799 [Ilumatobacteraceae bacterium]|nr:hypothetical protein [Ilumatobacteraceae bacterium]
MAAAAASAPADGQRPEPFVNIVVDHACVAEFLRHHANATSGDGHAERDEIANTGIANTGIANTRIANTGIEHLDFDVDDIDSGGRPDIDHAADRDARPPARVALAGDRRWRGCSTTDGHPLPVADAIAAMLVGRIRIVVIDERGVVLRMGRTQRLFTGKLREAVMLGAHECIWNGCNRPTGHCQADHITDWRRAGDTDVGSGAPLCAHHNRFKNHGFRVHRDVGHWHTYRPDGSEI